MNLEKAMSSGDDFIPESVQAIEKRFPRIEGELKRRPDTFIVEEQTINGVRCTTGTSSDFPNAWNDQAPGDLVALTLVKRRHTTPSAIKSMLQLLGLSQNDASVEYAGLKDFKAITSQRVVIRSRKGRTLDYNAIVRCCMPDTGELYRGGSGIFIKDAVRTRKGLRKGLLQGNNFDITIYVKGLTPAQLDEYIAPRVEYLSRRNGAIMIPNAFGRQRLGRRQNLFGVGYEFILNGPEAGIKRFLTEVTDSEGDQAPAIRNRLAREWADAEQKAQQSGTTVAQQVSNLHGMLEILEEGGPNPGQRNFERLNMVIEHKIVQGLLQHLDYEKTLRALEDDFSLWVGAYQALFFNKVLGDVLDGRLTLDPCDTGDTNEGADGEELIPLIMDEKRARKFYAKYCPQAVPERMDPMVRKIFLQPWNPKGRGPRRPLFVSVQEFEFERGKAERPDESAVRVKFRLRSGAYATTFLGILFDIDSNHNNNGGNRSNRRDGN
ncbi:MAG: tRNA pseudouridine(13) synthase TruD [Candidatus Obscuribacterales bacterium]|nr:tRNA pseudouridine(13) synthase TruD [Candidatus Obscuribacterales bacterium]